jgi:FemAB-related protein (PEP-CTERM system-associated)
LFHLPAWSAAVEQAYGHQPMHLAAWNDGTLAGVLPMFLVKSAIAGKLLVSIPYATYGGILATDDGAVHALAQQAKDICDEHGARCLELRHRERRPVDLPVIDKYDTFRKLLPDKVEDVLPSLPRTTRRCARQSAEELGPEAFQTGPHLVDEVYDLYAFTLRRLGSPNYSRRFFHALLDNYGEDCIFSVVKRQGKSVAGLVSFIFRDEITAYFSGCLPAAMECCANNLIYLRAMELGVQRGLRWFDFNRTRRDNNGPYSFKRRHGFEPSPLYYNVYLPKGQAAPNLSPSNSRFKLASNVWKRLPLWFTRAAGAQVSKWIP